MILFRLVLFMLVVIVAQSRYPEHVLCVNEECSEPISKAKTMLNHRGIEPEHISFPAKSEALVLMKAAGENSDLWYIKVNGRRGFASSRFLQEITVYERNLKIKKKYEPINNQTPVVQPDAVQREHEVIDGTIIYNTDLSNSQEGAIPISKSDPVEITPPIENPNSHSQNEDIALSEVNEVNNNLSKDINVPDTDTEQEVQVNNLNLNQIIPNNQNPIKNVQTSVNSADVDKTEDMQNIQDTDELIDPPQTQPLLSQALPSSSDISIVSGNAIEIIDQNNLITGSDLKLKDNFQNVTDDTLDTSDEIGLDSYIDDNNIDHNSEDSSEITEPHNKEIGSNGINTDVISQSINKDKDDFTDNSDLYINSDMLNSDSPTPTNNKIPHTSSASPDIQNKSDFNIGIQNVVDTVTDSLKTQKNAKTVTDTPSLDMSKSDKNINTDTANVPNNVGFDTVTASLNTKTNAEFVTDKPSLDTFKSDNSINTDAANVPINIGLDTVTTSLKRLTNTEIVTDKPSLDTSNSDNNINTDTANVPNNAGILNPDLNFKPTLQKPNEAHLQQNTENKISDGAKFNSDPSSQLQYEISSTTDTITAETVTDKILNDQKNQDNIAVSDTGKFETTTAKTLPQHSVYIENEFSSTTQIPKESNEYLNKPEDIIPQTESILTESLDSGDLYSSTASPIDISSTTDKDMGGKGFLSGMYSTFSSMLSTSTESPQAADSLFESEITTEHPKESVERILDNLKEPEDKNHIYHFDPPSEPEKNTVTSEDSFSYFNYFSNLYFTIMGTSQDTRDLFASAGEKCYTNEFPSEGKSQNNRLLMFLVTTASSVLLFILGYYYIDVKRQDGKFVAMVNILQRELLCATKECEILKEELTTTKTKLAGIEDSSFGMDDMVQSLKEEIEELKLQKERLLNSLDDNEKLLRVSENTAGELQNTLSEVENTLSELLAERAQSEEHIGELNGKIQAIEEELISVNRERDSYQMKYVSAEAALEESKKQKKLLDELNKNYAESKNTIDLKNHEIAALKETLKDLKSGASSNVDVTSLIDHTEIKAKLNKALEERNNYESKFKSENKDKVKLSEQLQEAQKSLQNVNQQANEATTRLEVLEKYFQDREAELMKELQSKEALWLCKQGESTSTIEKIELMQQEVQRYKEKCDALTLELAEAESARRLAESAFEARAHEAWLEARAARRTAAAERDVAAALRRKLVSLTPAVPASASPLPRLSSPLERMSDVLPPPLPFLPPPLLPPLPRPPPLGRLPSPTPRYSDRRYSPDSRYSPESRFSPDTARYSPDAARYSPESRYSPDRRRRTPPVYSPRRRRSTELSRERYTEGRRSRQRNGQRLETETEYGSDSPTRSPPRRRRSYYRHSGPSSGSGCSSESDK